MIAVLLKYWRRYLMGGDFFIGASIATTLTKLALRFVQLTANRQLQNQFCAEAMLVIASVLHLGRSGLPQKPISNDDAERLGLCLKVFLAHFLHYFNNQIRLLNAVIKSCYRSFHWSNSVIVIVLLMTVKTVDGIIKSSSEIKHHYRWNGLFWQVLAERSPVLVEVFTDACRRSISLMLAAKAEEESANQKNVDKISRTIQADDLVSFKQLLSRTELGGLEDVFESSLSQALIGSSQRAGLDLSVSKLNKVCTYNQFLLQHYPYLIFTVTCWFN